jgi:hypothetical protein
LEWSLDELIGVYLAESAPEQFALRQEDVWLEILGLRGTLSMNRLTFDEFRRHTDAQEPLQAGERP